MFLTRIPIPNTREGYSITAHRSTAHGIIERATGMLPRDGSQGRTVWRLDVKPRRQLLVVSPVELDLDVLAENGLTSAESKPYAAHLDSITDGATVRYLIDVNPTHAIAQPGPTGTRPRGKVVPVTGPARQTEWWIGKAADAGMVTDAGRTLVNGISSVTLRSKGRDEHLTIATITGQGTIKDAGLVRSAMTSGIGRGRAYGCGLLLVSLVESE